MQLITPAQNRRLHQLLATLDLMDDKAYYMKQASDGRTSSSKELTFDEATHLINRLQELAPAPLPSVKQTSSMEKMKLKILSLCHQMQWYREGVIKNGKKVLDYERLDKFCLERTAAKKKFNDMNERELREFVTQFGIIHAAYMVGVK